MTTSVLYLAPYLLILYCNNAVLLMIFLSECFRQGLQHDATLYKVIKLHGSGVMAVKYSHTHPAKLR